MIMILQFWMQAVWLFAFLLHVQNSYLPCRACLWSNNPMFLDRFTGRLPAERPVPRGLEWPYQQDEDKWNTFPAILQVCIYHSFCLPASPPPSPQLFVYHFFCNPAVYATLQVPHVTGGRTIHSHKCVIIYSWSRRQHMAVQSVTSLKITTLCIYTMLHAVFLDSWIPLTVSK